ncbi:ACT domain-containing protein [Clostridium sp. SGI.024]|uniref:ACT domain-containing protein n=1 Tax=Clostridium sp. SGI.024 TaxID=3420551 RepID=UPI003CFDFA8F
MEIKIINKNFSICKVEDLSEVNYSDEFCFIGKTDEELSVVCSTNLVPKNVIECDNGWKAFRIEGILDFSLIGILSKISTLLAENKIGIFAVSTYNTDYILTKEENFEKSIKVLEKNGYIIKRF